jgi:hypothetical protein
MTFRVIQQPAQTLSTWWHDQKEIDLDPVYQRKGHIWSNKQKQDLIDTILNGFDIPKFYLADFTFLDSDLNRNRKKYAVIDGKQRLITIFDFFDNQFTLSSKFTLYEEPDLRLQGLSYRDLQTNYPKIARRFENYNLTVMSVITDDEQKINELFLRLNASKPLVGAEIRNAMQGEVPELIRVLVEHPFWVKTRFNKLRGQDKNSAAKLLLIEHAGTFVDTKKKQLDDLVQEAKDVQEATVLIDRPESGANVLSKVGGAPSEVVPDLVEDPGADDAGALDEDVGSTTEALVEIAEETQTQITDIHRAAGRVTTILTMLEPLFVDRDELLNQQAQIPVIYWLAREVGASSLRHLRPFLLQFEADRRANRIRQPGDPDRDLELNDYELMARTSNDRASIGRRYITMRRRFDKFLEAADLRERTA